MISYEDRLIINKYANTPWELWAHKEDEIREQLHSDEARAELNCRLMFAVHRDD